MRRVSDPENIDALRRDGFLCQDCRLDTARAEHYYMLRDGLWGSICPQVIGMLCLPCAERRLRRHLVREDFSDAPINALQALKCPALAQRLARVAQPGPRGLNRRRRRRPALWG